MKPSTLMKLMRDQALSDEEVREVTPHLNHLLTTRRFSAVHQVLMTNPVLRVKPPKTPGSFVKSKPKDVTFGEMTLEDMAHPDLGPFMDEVGRSGNVELFSLLLGKRKSCGESDIDIEKFVTKACKDAIAAGKLDFAFSLLREGFPEPINAERENVLSSLFIRASLTGDISMLFALDQLFQMGIDAGKVFNLLLEQDNFLSKIDVSPFVEGNIGDFSKRIINAPNENQNPYLNMLKKILARGQSAEGILLAHAVKNKLDDLVEALAAEKIVFKGKLFDDAIKMAVKNRNLKIISLLSNMGEDRISTCINILTACREENLGLMQEALMQLSESEQADPRIVRFLSGNDETINASSSRQDIPADTQEKTLKERVSDAIKNLDVDALRSVLPSYMASSPPAGELKDFYWNIHDKYPFKPAQDEEKIIAMLGLCLENGLDVSKVVWLAINHDHARVANYLINKTNPKIEVEDLKKVLNAGSFAMAFLLLTRLDPTDPFVQEVPAIFAGSGQQSFFRGMTEDQYLKCLFITDEPSRGAWLEKEFAAQKGEGEINAYDLGYPSPYGFKASLYQELLPVMKLAYLVEENPREEINANSEAYPQICKQAYKLATLFSSKEAALTYLENYQKQNPTSEKPVHDACLFELPKNGVWDIPTWEALFLQEGGNRFGTILGRAPEIEKNINQGREPFRRTKELIHQRVYQGDDAEASRIANEKWEESPQSSAAQLNEIAQKRATAKAQKQGVSINELIEQEKETLLKDQARIKAGFIDQKKKEHLSSKYQSALNELVRSEMRFEDDVTNRVGAEIKRRDLGKMSYEEVAGIAASVFYPNAGKNPAFAKQCMMAGISEEKFDETLAFYLGNRKETDQLPQLFIDGNEVGEPSYYFMKLPKDDLRGFLLGYYTHSCQSIGSDAERVARHGMSMENSGFYVIMKKNGKKINPQEDTIVAQSWAWISKEGNLVFDSLEAMAPAKKTDFLKFYERAAKQVLGHQTVHFSETEMPKIQTIERVTLGMGGGTPKNLLYAPASPVEEFDGEKMYTDADTQYVLATKSLANIPPPPPGSLSMQETSVAQSRLSESVQETSVAQSSLSTSIQETPIGPPTLATAVNKFQEALEAQENLTKGVRAAAEPLRALFKDIKALGQYNALLNDAERREYALVDACRKATLPSSKTPSMSDGKAASIASSGSPSDFDGSGDEKNPEDTATLLREAAAAMQIYPQRCQRIMRDLGPVTVQDTQGTTYQHLSPS